MLTNVVDGEIAGDVTRVGDGVPGSSGDWERNCEKSQVDSKVGIWGRVKSIDVGRGGGGGVSFMCSVIMVVDIVCVSSVL